MEETAFKSLPANIFYFEDSDTVLVTDVIPGIVYRSTDAGVKWKQIKDIGEGKIGEVFPHPYSPQTAIAVGDKTTHWISKDRGETWEEFKTKYPVVRGRPLSFHADDPDRIIISTADCRGFECTPKVPPPSNKATATTLTLFIGLLHPQRLQRHQRPARQGSLMHMGKIYRPLHHSRRQARQEPGAVCRRRQILVMAKGQPPLVVQRLFRQIRNRTHHLRGSHRRRYHQRCCCQGLHCCCRKI
jgi:hypothetical protein